MLVACRVPRWWSLAVKNSGCTIDATQPINRERIDLKPPIETHVCHEANLAQFYKVVCFQGMTLRNINRCHKSLWHAPNSWEYLYAMRLLQTVLTGADAPPSTGDHFVHTESHRTMHECE